MKGILAILGGLGVGVLGGQIVADFRTSMGDFNVVLDFENAPLGVSNFIQLAGKGDDLFETAAGAPLVSDPAHRALLYRTTAASDSPKLPLNVEYVPGGTGTLPVILIKQNNTVLGRVSGNLTTRPWHQDLTGEDRVRLEMVSSNPRKYRVTLRYPRPWLDGRFLGVREAPMYRGLRISQVEPGKRFFAGGVTGDVLEHPGYFVQDEILRNPGNMNQPFGTPFNSAWVLAMDSLGPNRNGCRFFVTSAADARWNGRYTVLGFVLQNAGRAVVQSLANLPVDAQGKPTQEEVIYDITFRRGGLSEVAFFEGYHQQFLPGLIEPMGLSVERRGAGWALVSPWRPSTTSVLYQSTDLRNFSGGFFEAQPPGQFPPVESDLTAVVATVPRLFLKGFSAKMGSWPSAEIDFTNSEFSFQVRSEGDAGTMNLRMDRDVFTGQLSGTYALQMVISQNQFGSDPVISEAVGSGGFLAEYRFDQSPYRGVLSFSEVSGPLNVDELTFHFDSTRWANSPAVTESSIIRRFEGRTRDPAKPFLSYSGIYQKLR